MFDAMLVDDDYDRKLFFGFLLLPRRSQKGRDFTKGYGCFSVAGISVPG